MALKRIAHKATVGTKVLRDEGLLSFSIKSLQHIQKKTSKYSSAIKQPLYMRVKYRDALAADFNVQLPLWLGTNDKILRFNWVMPPPGKGSGGHLNIFRFIKFLEDAGHHNHIYLYADGGKGSVAPVKAVMGDSYPKLKASMEWLEDDQDMQAAHGTFATSWETAYAVFNSQLTTKRFYFVQDFEPYFYPSGSMYALAENTYKFGFYGITAGGWLSKKLADEYKMPTDHFNFGADKQLYSFMNDKPRKEVFCYVRPYTERRGFELAVMVLDLFHQKHPDYKINLAGWDVSGYDLPFPYENLSLMEVGELNALYNRCAAGLVLSFTNMSLLPLELLSSGAIPVVNDGENNRLVSDNGFIAYAADNPTALATGLSDVVSRPDAVAYAKKAAVSVSGDSWQEAGAKFVSIVERETRRHE